MKDVQKESPRHKLPINMAGIKGLRYPIRVLDRKNRHQDTVALVNMFVDLPRHYRGTHMSRFVEILNKYRGEITYKKLRPILESMKRAFSAKCAHLSMEFPYFVEKRSPKSKILSLMEYTAFFEASMENGDFFFELGVVVPITTLCPCSREISDCGAHNQRAYVTIRVSMSKFVWIEELIELAENSASAPVFSILKRPDEKIITEQAYQNPRFVEDVARHIANELILDGRIGKFRVEVESIESIHNHNAYAMIEGYGGARK